MPDDEFAGWPAQSETVTIDGLEISVTLQPNGTVSASPVPVDPGTTHTFNHHGGRVVLRVRDEKIYVTSDGPIHFGIPYADDGTIPAIIGRKSLPGWLMKELRSLGFHYENGDAE